MVRFLNLGLSDYKLSVHALKHIFFSIREKRNRSFVGKMIVITMMTKVMLNISTFIIFIFLLSVKSMLDTFYESSHLICIIAVKCIITIIIIPFHR